MSIKVSEIEWIREKISSRGKKSKIVSACQLCLFSNCEIHAAPKNDLRIGMESTSEVTELGTGWIEFSERHARAASSDFARSVVQYFNNSIQPEARSQVSHKELLKKFIDCFSENFEYEYLRRSVQQGNKVSKK